MWVKERIFYERFSFLAKHHVNIKLRLMCKNMILWIFESIKCIKISFAGQKKDILRFVFICKHIIVFGAYKKWFHGNFHHSKCMKIRFAGQKNNILCTIFIDRKTTWEHGNTESSAHKRWFYACLYQSRYIWIQIEHVRVRKVIPTCLEQIHEYLFSRIMHSFDNFWPKIEH